MELAGIEPAAPHKDYQYKCSKDKQKAKILTKTLYHFIKYFTSERQLIK